MSKLVAAVLAAFLATGLAHAAERRHVPHTRKPAAAQRSTDATVMSLTRMKPCSANLVKRARGCVSSALASNGQPDTRVMGDVGEPRGVPARHGRKHRRARN